MSREVPPTPVQTWKSIPRAPESTCSAQGPSGQAFVSPPEHKVFSANQQEKGKSRNGEENILTCPSVGQIVPHAHAVLFIAVYTKQPNHVAGVFLKEMHESLYHIH